MAVSTISSTSQSPAAAQEPLTPTAPVAKTDKGSENTPLTVFANGNDSPSFGDILDIINPLQHIPIIDEIYRNLTGDKIGVGARVLGGALYGGVIGLGAALVDLGVQDATGKDLGGQVLSAFEDDDTAKSDTQLASQDGKDTKPTAVAAGATPVASPAAEASLNGGPSGLATAGPVTVSAPSSPAANLAAGAALAGAGAASTAAAATGQGHGPLGMGPLSNAAPGSVGSNRALQAQLLPAPSGKGGTLAPSSKGVSADPEKLYKNPALFSPSQVASLQDVDHAPADGLPRASMAPGASAVVAGVPQGTKIGSSYKQMARPGDAHFMAVPQRRAAVLPLPGSAEASAASSTNPAAVTGQATTNAPATPQAATPQATPPQATNGSAANGQGSNGQSATAKRQPFTVSSAPSATPNAPITHGAPDQQAIQRALKDQGLAEAQHPLLQAPSDGADQKAWFSNNVMSALDKYQKSSRLGMPGAAGTNGASGVSGASSGGGGAPLPLTPSAAGQSSSASSLPIPPAAMTAPVGAPLGMM